jgi:anaerobic selenocysteine-containing dehydrogenase
MFGRKLVNPPGECRSNHDVICDLAARVGAAHEGFTLTPRQLIDRTLTDSKRRSLDDLDAENWFDVQPDFETSHFLNGFAHPDGKYHFRADWKKAASIVSTMGVLGPWREMPVFPDHWAVTEPATPETPFRLTTSPARTFLNSSFNETPGSRKREGGPSLRIHADDLAGLGATDGSRLRVGNARGEVILQARATSGVQRGVVIAEGIWPNEDHENGCGINTLTGADQPAPAGGGVFHDIAVWIRPA